MKPALRKGISGLATALLLALAAPAVHAGEFDALAGAWLYDVRGIYVDRGQTLDFQRDLGLSGRSPTLLSAAYVPDHAWYPIAAIDYQRIAVEGTGTVTAQSSIGLPLLQIPFSVSDRVDSRVALNDLDGTLELKLPIPHVQAGLGAMLKYVDGDVVVDDQTSGRVVDDHVHTLIPLVYARLGAHLSEWLRLDVSGGWIADDNDEADQERATLTANWGVFAVTAGWQRAHYRIGDQLDARVSGALLGLNLIF
jgi:hypothetical protein